MGYSVLPVGRLREVDLEVVVAEIEDVDAVALAGLDELTNDSVGVWLKDIKGDLLTGLVWTLRTLEAQLAPASYNYVDLLVFFVQDFEGVVT